MAVFLFIIAIGLEAYAGFIFHEELSEDIAHAIATSIWGR